MGRHARIIATQLVKLIDDPRPEARNHTEAIHVYQAYHGVSQAEAKHAIVCLDKSLIPVVPCPSCGRPLRTPLCSNVLNAERTRADGRNQQHNSRTVPIDRLVNG